MAKQSDTIEKSKVEKFFEKDGSFSLIKRLFFENFGKYAKRYAVAIFFMALVAATTALSAWLIRDVIESIFVERDFRKIVIVGVTFGSIFIVKGFSTYIQSVILARIGSDIVAEIQMKIYKRVIQQGGDFYIRYPSNDLLMRIGGNAGAARSVIDMVVMSLGRDLLTLIGLVIVMLVQDWFLTLMALFFVPPVIFVIVSFIKRVRKFSLQKFESNTLVLSAMQDTLRGIKIVKSFGLENSMTERMSKAVDDVRTRNVKIAEVSARTSPLMESLGGICIAGMVIYAGWRVVDTNTSPGEFISFMTAMLLAYEPAKRLARLHLHLESALVGVRLMYEILDLPLMIKDKRGAKKLKVTKGNIKFRDVNFSYIENVETDLQVLHALTIDVAGGKTTALVGASGGGKTTITNLIQRFYDIKGGTLEIDGLDIRNVSLESLRNNITYVSQDTFLFTGNVKDNILAGRPGASFEEVKQAARDANAHEFIEELPEGYETQLGEDGSSLSGGQRQRLAIARAILKNAPIVLLDEATSSLDAESEKLVQEAFERLKKGRTTLVIAHRLSTIRNADCIHVIDDGQCIESGNHDVLMKTGVAYKHLYDLQFNNSKKNPKRKDSMRAMSKG